MPLQNASEAVILQYTSIEQTDAPTIAVREETDAPVTSAKESGDGVNFICRLDRSIYSCVTEDITTDEVVITEERIAHSNRHKDAYDKYGKYLSSALAAPSYIFEDKMPNTGIVVKRLVDEEGKSLQIVLRIKTSSDDPSYKNSIISCWDISEARLGNYIRNRKMLYKSPEE